MSATTRAIAPAAPILAREAHLDGPVDVIFDSAGNLYVSDCSWTYSHIYRIDPKGMMTTFAGAGPTDFSGDGGPATSADLQCPTGMAFGPDGALYFADHASNRIRRIDTAGIITTVAGSGPAGVDQGSFSGDGGPATKATLQEPWGVAFDSKGDLYIGDRDNHRVRMVDTTGVISTVAGTGTSATSGDGSAADQAATCPLGVAVDSAGDLLIDDRCSNRPREVGPDGVIGTIAGTGSAGFSGAGSPTAHFAFDASGKVLIQEGHVVGRIDGGGLVTTTDVGSLTDPPTDGMALEAPFTLLYGMAVDTLGNVYVSDGFSSVYRIDAHGVITLFAGK